MLKIAIVGLPNVGKSTIFNALTNANVLAANYPFATIEPNTGIVPVPDDRLAQLAKLYQSDKIIPATVEFVDVAGLVAGASHGEGLGNKFLANIRECHAICHVVRAFANDKIQRADGSTTVDPQGDIEIINTELALADLATIEKHLPKLQKEAKSNVKLRPQVDFLQQIQTDLLAGRRPAAFDQLTREELSAKLDGLSLLTALPVIYLFNVNEATLSDSTAQKQLLALAAKATASTPDQINAVFISAELESELRLLDANDQQDLMQSYGINEPSLNRLARVAYHTLGLQSFLTAGKKEVRAWTIHQGWTAPEAAGVIHTDFQKGFIAAQIVSYNDLMAAGSEAAARAAGKLRTEGRNYVMQDGDIVEFRFNV